MTVSSKSIGGIAKIKTLGVIWGILFMLGGILGFVPGITKEGMFLGIFMVNTPHGILHIASGVIFLIASMIGAGAARLWFQTFGSFYAALAIIGLLAGDGLIFNLISNNLYDAWGHAFLGVILLVIGFAVPGRVAATAANSSTPSVVRYHPALVALHWIMAVAIIFPLALGVLVLSKLPTTDPLIYHGLQAHMSVGFLLGILMVVRLFIRASTKLPKPATTGSALLDRVTR